MAAILAAIFDFMLEAADHDLLNDANVLVKYSPSPCRNVSDDRAR
jgi:hypothetical protein